MLCNYFCRRLLLSSTTELTTHSSYPAIIAKLARVRVALKAMPMKLSVPFLRRSSADPPTPQIAPFPALAVHPRHVACAAFVHARQLRFWVHIHVACDGLCIWFEIQRMSTFVEITVMNTFNEITTWSTFVEITIINTFLDKLLLTG